MRRGSGQLIFLSACAVLASGCEGRGAVMSVPVACDLIRGVAITREVVQPSGAREVTIRLAFDEGTLPTARDLSHCLALVDDRGAALPAVVTPRTVASAHTLMLVDPGSTAADNENVRAAVMSLARARPPGERLALFRWGRVVTQVQSFTSDRSALAERLSVGLPIESSRPAPPEDAILAITKVLGDIDTHVDPSLRSVVMISPRPAEAKVAAADPHLLLWMGPGGFGLDGAAAVSARMDAEKQVTHYGLGYCGPADAHTRELRVAGSSTVRARIKFPKSLPESAATGCDPMKAARGETVYPTVIEVRQSPQEEIAAEEARRVLGPKAEFRASMFLWPNRPSIPVIMNWRGESSLGCRRKNYTIKVQDNRARSLMPGSSASEFFLTSMCLDRLYLNTPTSTQILSDEGLYSPSWRLVELRFNTTAGRDHAAGVYLMVEKVPEALVKRHSRVTSVIRRGYASKPVEVKKFVTTADGALLEYENILAAVRSLSGSSLVDGLRARLDLDQYLSFMAMMAILGSGDYVDEVYFYATETTGPDGKPGMHHHVSLWDQDSLFTPCHFDGREAIKDVYGLLVCAEADLDKKIFADATVYARYVDILEPLVQRYTVGRFKAVLDTTVVKLLGFFESPGVLDGMIELDRIDRRLRTGYDAIRAGLTAEAASMVSNFETNRHGLIARIAAYRRSLP